MPVSYLVLTSLAARVKAHELREKSREELLKQAEDLKNELAQLRVSKVSGQGGASKLSKMCVCFSRLFYRGPHFMDFS